MIIYFSIIILFNAFLFLFYKKFTKLLNIYDKPDKIRRFHEFSVPISGGLIICLNFIIFAIYFFYFDNKSTNINSLYSLFIAPLVFFFFGLYDDKYTITAKKKLFFLSFFILKILLIDDNLVIKKLNFYQFNKNYILAFPFSLFFTTLCILLFINALNMFDGVNIQASFYCLMLFLFFLAKDFNFILSLTLIISLFFFIILNIRKKSFLGDGGIYLLAYLISYIIILNYNLKNNIKIEEIFILMLIPGLDMFRLFILRLYQNRSPFDSDRNHIHHILIKKFNLNTKDYFFTIPTVLTFCFYFLYQKTNSVYLIFFFIFLYLFAIFYKIK